MENATASEPSFLYLQTTLSGWLVPITSNATDKYNSNQSHILTLNNISSSTIAFSDWPNRIVSQLDTQTFTDKWNVGQDNFKNDPPNTAIAIDNNGRET